MVTRNHAYGRRTGKRGLPGGARAVAPTYGRTAHPVAAEKFANRIPFMVESEAEQLVSGMLDLDPEVVALCPQGFTVDLREGVLLYTPEQRKAAEVKYRKVPGPSLYTTDFFVELDGNRRRALEVKLDSFQGEDEYVAKLITARPIIERFGLDLWLGSRGT